MFVCITSVRRPCRVRVTSFPHPCVNLREDMPRMWHAYDKDNTDTGRTWHWGDTDLIRTFVRVSYFDCLKIIDTDKFGPGDRGGYDTDVIRTWTGRQGHDTDTCPCHVRVSIRVCVNVALITMYKWIQLDKMLHSYDTYYNFVCKQWFVHWNVADFRAVMEEGFMNSIEIHCKGKYAKVIWR